MPPSVQRMREGRQGWGEFIVPTSAYRVIADHFLEAE